MDLSRFSRWGVVAAAVVTAAGIATASPGPSEPAGHAGDGWVGAWGNASNGVRPDLPDGCVGCTIRNVVHTSVGGSAVRVRLSNAFGTKAVTMKHVTVAVAAGSKTAQAKGGTLRQVTFGGAATFRLAPGSEVLSDPVPLAVPSGGNLLVTTYTPDPSGPVTYTRAAYQTSFLATAGGDHASEEAAAAFNQTTGFTHYVTGVDVRDPAARGTVVAFGDSITAGSGSGSNTNQRWPDLLADRLRAQPPSHQFGVVDEGIPGNALLTDSDAVGGVNALARLDRDVFDKTNVRTVIMLLGINDVKTPDGDPALIIAALHQIVDQAHARGIRVLGATLTPFKGYAHYSDAYEQSREKVNNFIRTSHVYDGVVDFEAAVKNPADPLAIRPDFDSGDHLHPNPAGYHAMAAAVNLGAL